MTRFSLFWYCRGEIKLVMTWYYKNLLYNQIPNLIILNCNKINKNSKGKSAFPWVGSHLPGHSECKLGTLFPPPIGHAPPSTRQRGDIWRTPPRTMLQIFTHKVRIKSVAAFPINGSEEPAQHYMAFVKFQQFCYRVLRNLTDTELRCLGSLFA